MKKTLLLSVVASTMIMAGGDIAPVEPVVEAPIEVYGWEFTGQAVAYTQTKDDWGLRDGLFGDKNDLFSGNSTSGELGLQLGATNKDVIWGIGAGVELSGIGSGYNSGYSNSNFGLQSDSGITQAYLTYGMSNTSLKVGRQQLPKALSPFAFTEGWQMFKNSFDAALLVNTDISDTVLVYAFVNKANRSVNDISDFQHINRDGVHMVTAANKSIDNLALTGTWYYANNMIREYRDDFVISRKDVNILWGDAKYGFGEDYYGLVIGVQGGVVQPGGSLLDDTSAFGAKIGGKYDVFDAYVAYSSVNDGDIPIHNLGTGVKTPLYTQLILNQNTIKKDSNTVVVKAGMKALGGKFGLAYNYSTLDTAALPSVFAPAPIRVGGEVNSAGQGNYQEIDVTYKTKITENTTLFAGYVWQDENRDSLLLVRGDETHLIPGFSESQNFIRFWARYDF